MRIWDDPQLKAAHDTRKAARLKRYVRRMRRIYPGWGFGRVVPMFEAPCWAVQRGHVTITDRTGT